MKKYPLETEIPEIKFIAARGAFPGADNGVKQGYELLGENSPVVPARKMLPTWFKDAPYSYPNPELKSAPPDVDRSSMPLEVPTVKKCPGINDYIGAGYIVPAWTDMRFDWKEGTNNEWMVSTGDVIRTLDDKTEGEHPPFQSHDYGQAVGAPFWDNSCHTIVKVITPWYIKVSKGVSVIITQPFYHTSTDFTIMPGILDCDIDSVGNLELNCFVKINTQKRPIFIEMGSPFIQIIPFIRTNFKFECVTEPSENEYRHFERLISKQGSTFKMDNNDAKNITNGKCPFDHNNPNPNRRFKPMKNSRHSDNKNFG